VDLEKAFYRVLREVIRWAMRKLGVEEWYVSEVMSMHTGAKTVVRTVYGNSNSSQVCTKVQHSVLYYLWLSWKLYLENSELPYHCKQRT